MGQIDMTQQRATMGQDEAAGQGQDRKQAPPVRQETASCQVRRVGSVTFGIVLICYGILFLVHIFVPVMGYRIIFKCWPVIFILLGVEILVENHKCRVEEWKLVYDFPAILMLAGMLLFAMVMAVIEYAMAYGTIYF